MAGAPEHRTIPAQIDVSLRVDFGKDIRLGPGKIALLEAVRRDGSISAAGRAMGMSYRRAWMLIDDLNRSFGQPVVAATTGGAKGGGASVTAFGEGLIDAYRRLEDMSNQAAQAAFAEMAPTGQDETPSRD